MRKKRLFLSVAWFAVVMEVAWSFPTEAAPANEALTIGYSSFSGHYVPLWIAVEDRLGRKYRLDLKAVYAGRARPQQLLMSGETPLVVATGTGAGPTVHGTGSRRCRLVFRSPGFARQKNGISRIGQLRKAGDRLSVQYRDDVAPDS